MIPVERALEIVLEGVRTVAEAETLPLPDAHGRVLAADVTAPRDQPPFRASAMDGYAIRAAEAAVGARLRVVGESSAGSRHDGPLGEGEAVRIFTGAPVPDGADAVLIQENATREGDAVVPREATAPGRFVRPAGLDFAAGATLARAGERIDAGRLGLLAAANIAAVPVRRAPRVSVVATGDELVPLGGALGPDEIVASSVLGVVAILRGAGANARDAGIARDTMADLAATLDAATADDPDLVVTLGGASVGRHDLVAQALRARGVVMAFERVAMRPGKPLMHGREEATGRERAWLGLPGNPVSSLVCAHLFGVPLVARLLGATSAQRWIFVNAGADLPANDERQDYLRVTLDGDVAAPLDRQDSSQMSRFAAADALLVRPPHAPEAAAGTRHRALVLR